MNEAVRSTSLPDAGLLDREIDQFLGVEEAFPEVVALAVGDDELHQGFLSGGFVAVLEFGGVFFERDDFVVVAVDDRERDFGFGQDIDAGDGIELVEA